MKPYVVTWISKELWVGPQYRPVSQTRLIHSHTTSKILPHHQGILCQSMAFPALVCAQNCLVATLLTKALFLYIAEIIQAQNDFLVQEQPVA
jgi:hypothetical protein